MFYGAMPIKIFVICSSLVTVLASEACFGYTEAIVRHHLAQMLAVGHILSMVIRERPHVYSNYELLKIAFKGHPKAPGLLF